MTSVSFSFLWLLKYFWSVLVINNDPSQSLSHSSFSLIIGCCSNVYCFYTQIVSSYIIFIRVQTFYSWFYDPGEPQSHVTLGLNSNKLKFWIWDLEMWEKPNCCLIWVIKIKLMIINANLDIFDRDPFYFVTCLSELKQSLSDK